MKLYEIIKELDSVLENLPINEETGEIMDEELFEKLNALATERDEKIENLALSIKNLTAFAEDLKAEKMAIAKRQQRAEKTIESLRKYLEFILGGAKFTAPRCEVNFRKTTRCEITDESLCIDQLMSRPDFMNCYKVKTEINRAEVTKLIKQGYEIGGAELVSSLSMSIK